MSTVVDNRIVDMQFNNREFEDGVQTSIKSLDALKKGLNLGDSAKSFGNLGTAARGIDLSGISGGVQNISSKFSALGVVGFTVFQNLTNGAIGLATKMIDVVTGTKSALEGLSEYETQMNAVQTIMANTSTKGTTLDEVNKALAELNTYADKTIYSFPEMTRNIGTFTAAGLGLRTSVDAIKGIANLAAVSGSNSQQASTAMYQLSQALSSGTLKLQDWNSVVNAGMGGQVFQDALKETARVHGVTVDKMIKEEGSFRESLQKGWITSEILTETLSKFTGDLSAQQLTAMGYTEEQIQGIIKMGTVANDAATKVKTFSQLKETLMESITSGWASSWQLVLGDFEEAKGFFTDLSGMLGGLISASSDARNQVLADWKKFGGRVALIDSVTIGFNALMKAVTPVKEAFREIFPPITGYQLKMLTVAFRDLMTKLTMGPETADKVKRAFKGLFAAADIVRQVIFALVGVFGRLFTKISPAGGSILDFLARMGDYIVKFRDGLNVTEKFNDAIEGVKDVFGKIKTAVVTFVGAISEKVEIFKQKFSETFGAGFKKVDTSGIMGFFSKIHIRFEPLTKLAEFMGRVFGGLGNVLAKVAPLIFKVGGAIVEFIGKLGTELSEGLMNLDFSNLFDSINGGLIAALILALRKFVTEGTGAMGDIKGIFGGISGVLDGVKGSLQAWQQSLKAKTLITIALAIAILAGSLVLLSTIDSAKLTFAIAAITAMFLELNESMTAFSKISGGKGSGQLTFAASLIGTALAVLVLSAALKNIADIDPKGMTLGLLAMEALMVMLSNFSKVMGKSSSGLIKSAVGLILFGVAFEIFANVIKKLGAIKMEELKQGLIGVGAVLAEIAIFLKVTDLSGGGIRKATGILILAGAIMVLSIAVEKFGGMDPSAMQQGLIAVGVVLGEISAFVNLTGDSKKVISTAIGLTIMAASMLIFAQAISMMGKMSWEEIGKGLVAMAGALVLMFAAVKSFPKGMLLTGIGLLVVASAMVVMSKALKMMGGMSWEEVGRGLVALAGSFIVIAAGMYAMQGALPGAAALLVVSAALAIFAPVLKTLGGMSLGEIGMGLLALAGVFVILGIAGYALTPVIPTLFALAGVLALFGLAIALAGAGILAFSIGLTALAAAGAAGAIGLVAFFSAILSLIPMIVTTIVKAIVQFAVLIGESAPAIAKALEETLLALIDVIVKVTPPLIDALVLLILQLIDAAVKLVPKLIEAAMTLIGALLTTFAANLPKFIKAGVDIIMAILKGIRDNIGQIVTVAVQIITNFLTAIAEQLPSIIDAGFNVIVSFIDGLADAIEKNADKLNEAIAKLAKAIIDGLVEGILAGAGAVAEAVWELIKKAIAAFTGSEGLDAHSPSKVTTRIGEYASQGFANGISNLSSAVKGAASSLTNEAVDVMTEAISSIYDLLSGNMEFAPSIRPVVDLTDVIYGSNQIDKLLGAKNFSLATALDKLPTVPTKNSNNSGSDSGNSAQTNQAQSISFVQNNYSPVPLTTIEIYRQTRNQLNTLKGLVRKK